MKWIVISALFVSVMSYQAAAWAYDAHEISEIAKSRTYPGGAEESDLKLIPAEVMKRSNQDSVKPPEESEY